MSGLLYYRRGEGQLAEGELESLGVLHAFTDRKPSLRQVTGGPDDRSGLIFADPDRLDGRSVGYYADSQEWKPYPEDSTNPTLWVGWYRDGFKNDSLKRKSTLPGPSVELSDGRKWNLPLVRQWDVEQGAGRCCLPSTLKHDGSSWVLGNVKAEYEELWEICNRYWQTLITEAFGSEGENVEFDFDGFVDLAVMLLSVNYVVSTAEISALGLLDEATLNSVVHSCIDFQTFADWLVKKNASAPVGATTPAGVEV